MEQKISGSRWFAYDTKHIGVLDGIRAIAILIVLWFHFWQQTWLMPYYPTPMLERFGYTAVDLNLLRRCGYLCVDLMILISGFVLFLPYARHRIEGTPIDSTGVFYRKRAARILPSYLFSVTVMFVVSLLQGSYLGRASFMWHDLLSHLTFTFMLRADTYLFTAINGVLWTVVIEVMFYAIMPQLGKLFERFPVPTYLVMVAVGLGSIFLFYSKQSDLSLYVNRFFTFLPVFANGMLGAYVYVWFVHRAPIKPAWSGMGIAVAIGALLWLQRLFEGCLHAQSIQYWQLTMRYPLSIAYLLLVLGFCLAPKPIRRLLDNRVLGAIAAVSYNVYLWHHFIIVHLRAAFGCSNGADVTALGAQTQWILTVEGLVLTFIAAILITYGIERPFRNWIMGRSLRIENMHKTGEKHG